MRLTEYLNSEKALTEMPASHLMERNVVYFEADGSCHDIAEAMVKKNFGDVPIVDGERRVIGIVTEYDLLNALMKGDSLKKVTAAELMTRPPIVISEETPEEEIVALLQSRHLIRVPVVDSEGKLVGIVARRDILAGYIESTLGPLPVF